MGDYNEELVKAGVMLAGESSLAVHGNEWNLECEVRPLDGDVEHARE